LAVAAVATTTVLLGCSGSTETSATSGSPPPPDRGSPGVDVVSAGAVSKSENYRMVFTVGQSTQNQEKMTSPSYRMQGGLIGASGGLK